MTPETEKKIQEAVKKILEEEKEKPDTVIVVIEKHVDRPVYVPYPNPTTYPSWPYPNQPWITWCGNI